MKQFGKTIQAKILAQFLVLAIFTSLTGHVFLHLGDEPFNHEETHQVSAHHEEPSAQSQSHQCSICLDHQALSLDLPVHSFELNLTIAVALYSTYTADYQSNAQLFTSDRAPPRS